MNPIALPAPLPPFCTMGSDQLPTGPLPGTPESMALAAWEVLTGARLARSTGSGRMSLLGAHRAEGGQLTRDRTIWIALHAFEGAAERWACRLARSAAMNDRDLETAIVQEMGGPVQDPEEMTALGFWLGDVGFSFDARGPSIESITYRSRESRAGLRRGRFGRATIMATARRLLAIPAYAEAADAVFHPDAEAIQLSLL